MQYLYYFVAFLAFPWLSGISCLIIHELGHAIPALLFTPGKVSVYLGSYGEPEKSLHLRLGRLSLYAKMHLKWFYGGLCVPETATKHLWQSFFITLLGPLTELAVGCLALYVVSSTPHMAPSLKWFLTALGYYSFFTIFYNLIPRKKAVQLPDGKWIGNDGDIMQTTLALLPYTSSIKKAYQLLEAQQYHPAADIYFKIWKKTASKSIEPHLIYSLMQSRQYQLAESLYPKIKEREELNAADYTELGLAKAFLKDYAEALEDFHRGLNLDPQDFLLLQNEAYSLLMLQQYEAAIQKFDHLIERDVTEGNSISYSLANRGLAKYRVGQKEQGMADLHQAMNLEANEVYAYFNLGIINFENGLYEAARTFFEQAHAISPGIHLLKEYRDKLPPKKA